MSDESQVIPAAEAAPESGHTASPEPAEHEAQAEETSEPKTFTQEELDALIAKEKAKVERKLRRELAQAAEQPRQPATEAPKPDQFKTIEEYLDALADHKAEVKLAEREQRQQQEKADATFEEREEKAREKYGDDFDIVYRLPKDGGPAITPEMAHVIKASEVGPDIAYHLAKNRDESLRIANLDPLSQAREIGKIEAKLIESPPAKKVTSAPEPIKPVGARTTTPKFSTSDPRSAKSMSPGEWIEARNKELREKHR